MKTLGTSGRLCIYVLGFQGFPNSVKGWGKNPPPSSGVSEILLEGRFFIQWWELEEGDVDHSNLFQS